MAPADKERKTHHNKARGKWVDFAFAFAACCNNCFCCSSVIAEGYFLVILKLKKSKAFKGAKRAKRRNNSVGFGFSVFEVCRATSDEREERARANACPASRFLVHRGSLCRGSLQTFTHCKWFHLGSSDVVRRFRSRRGPLRPRGTSHWRWERC